MDRDPGPGVRDFTCGDLSYDGHKGTDFALPTLAHMARGVDVLAAAPGRVRAARDGMPDQKFGAANADDVAGRECGNGVVLLHPGGFETQYCHLKSGSIAVRPGDEIRRGDVLGQVGLSGKTQFPHLHLSVRRDGVEIDPFDPAMSDACGGGGPGLWSSPAPSYRAGGLSEAGFTDALPAYDDVLAGTAARGALPQDAPAMVLFGLAYGGRMGDTLRFDLTGPGGTVLNQELQLDKDQAQFFRAVGKRRRDAAWQAGRYLGVIEFRRGNTLLDRHTVEIRVR
jgi:hypothetical protein